ncbi:hypothetical protein FOCC_FOCC013811 [Frankliniella occidentalis]|nr:hypothetical protein FOCC_FOCC013811 [Frankliniella occidentalis]
MFVVQKRVCKRLCYPSGNTAHGKREMFLRGMAAPPVHPIATATTPPQKRKLAMLSSPPGRKEVFPVFSSLSLSPGKSKSKHSPGSSPSKKRANLTLKQGAAQNNKMFRYLLPKRLFKGPEAVRNSPVSLQHETMELDNKENKVVNGVLRCESEEVQIVLPKATSSIKRPAQEMPSVPHNSGTSPKKPAMAMGNDPLSSPKRLASVNQCLDVKVVLVRVDEHTFGEHSYCMKHKSPRKYCCSVASEYVTQAIDNLIDDDIKNPCKRLGIPSPTCIAPMGCNHFKDDSSSSSHQENLYETMLNIDLPLMMLRACCQDLSSKTFPSPGTIHTVFNLMKNNSDAAILALGRTYLRRVIDHYPPCNPHMRSYYIHILNSSVSRVKIPSDLWGLTNFQFFDGIFKELEDHVEGSLNPEQLKEKMKVPGVRKKCKPKRFQDSPSPKKNVRRKSSKDSISESTETLAKNDDMSSEAIRERLKAEEDKGKVKMPTWDKTSQIFAMFETLVDILEWDLVVWLAKNGERVRSGDRLKIRDRSVCPLIVMILWPNNRDTGLDSPYCCRIFSLYVSAWILKFHPRHIKTLVRLVGLIAEVIIASESNFGNVYPYVGEGCENLARKLCEVLRNPLLGELQTKAIAMLKPDWLKMLVSSFLLNVSPTTASLML